MKIKREINTNFTYKGSEVPMTYPEAQFSLNI